MTKECARQTRDNFMLIATASVAARAHPSAFAASTNDGKPAFGEKLRTTRAGLFEDVNTPAVATMYLATITGSSLPKRNEESP